MIQKKPNLHIPFFVGVPALVWQVLFFYLPLLFIVFSSIAEISDTGAFIGITLSKIWHFIDSIYLKVIGLSLLLALSTAFICLIIAYPLAYFIAFTIKRGKNFLLFLIVLPFWTNFLLHVYAWFFILEREGVLNNFLMAIGIITQPIQFLNSIFAIMIMMVYCYLPFMLLPIYAALERFDVRLMEASLDLGATRFQTFRNIILPISLTGARAGFFLVYIPAFGEFAIPELMGGDRQMFVGSIVSHYILGEETGSLGAAFTLVSGVVLVISAAIFYIIIERFKPRIRHV